MALFKQNSNFWHPKMTQNVLQGQSMTSHAFGRPELDNPIYSSIRSKLTY